MADKISPLGTSPERLRGRSGSVRAVGVLSVLRKGAMVLSYETLGEQGDPVVLIHGSLVDRTSWLAVFAPLAVGLQVTAYDRRGYGESTGPRRIRAVRDDAQDLSELLETTGLFPAHLVAHSYAGAVALRLAADRPELVRSLALHEPPLIGLLGSGPAESPDARQWIDLLERLLGAVRSGEEERAAREVVDAFSARKGAWKRLPPEARAQAIRYIGLWADEFSDPEATEPVRASLRELYIPVLLTTGAQSPPIVQQMAGALAAELTNATLRTLPETGHAPHITGPDRYLGILTTFLLERIVPTV